ncbi:bifunctional DNA primase/polymerase [Nocardia terpenica]|uniref:DNA primase/polymerase bifunctional N-terminal domain-containing protein n=1 Tax=Nocardia terpenica TaxID=455432 RepID=A0A291RRE5_9NOCA|nr:bifunctional DNA primase/polymerase [Nocardia terpenica]ATL69870.1 hypothetical protein CRH09_30555 [Nocardia terpenica]
MVGDSAEADRIEALLDRIDSTPPRLGDAALVYASWGWPVFPLRPGGKVPATRHGFKDATTDTARIRAWWKAMPGANIGLATGAVVDDQQHSDLPPRIGRGPSQGAADREVREYRANSILRVGVSRNGTVGQLALATGRCWHRLGCRAEGAPVGVCFMMACLVNVGATSTDQTTASSR